MRTPPHLPFLAGPPRFAAGLKPIAPEAWLAPDWEAHTLAEKRTRLGPATVRCLAQAREAVEELALAAAEAEPAVGAQLNRALLISGDQPRDGGALLAALAATISDDVVVLIREDHGWRVGAAALCAPTFFSLEEAFAAPHLTALHGPVPQPDLGPLIERIFDRLPEGMVSERFNWTVQSGAERFTPSQAPLVAAAAQVAPHHALDVMHLRVERQTIRRLPASGAVVFTIRVSLDPLRQVFAVEGARPAFAAAWAGAEAKVRAYKKWDAYEAAVQAALIA